MASNHGASIHQASNDATSRFLVATASLLILGACGTGQPSAMSGRSDTAVVVDVIDGDTVRLNISGRTETVRLIGINTPETKHPTKGVQCFGPEASAFLTQLLPPGTSVRVERDAEARDSYRRLLLYLFVTTSSGERFVNLELVSRGFATPLSIEPNVHYQRHIVDAAFDAQHADRGLWGSCR